MSDGRRLRLGFIPLDDAAPLIAAQARGFFTAEGLEVELSREVSWATIRDKMAVGALDGAHMLAPLALAMGLGGAPAVALRVLSRAGAAVVLSHQLAEAGEPSAALRRLSARRRAEGEPPPTFAVVFPHALHNYLLRAWLSAAGAADAQVIVAPPPRMAELLAEGIIDGFSAGEPWSSLAVEMGAGVVAARAAEMWPQAPDKVFAVREDLLLDLPQACAALARALERAAAWCAEPAHRGELAQLLAAPAHVGLGVEVLASSLASAGLVTGEAAHASDSDSLWLVGQMSRWGQLDGPAAVAVARRTFRTVPASAGPA